MIDGFDSRGLMAASLAKNHGCYVAATSRSEKSRDLVLSTGADEFIIDNGNIASTLTSESTKFDKILELLGVTTLLDSIRCCRGADQPGKSPGLVCMTGIAGGKWDMEKFAPMTDIMQGVALTRYSGGGEAMKMTPFAEIIKDVEQGKLKVLLGKTFKLEDIVEAHMVMEKGGSGGKMVLLMQIV